MPPTPGLTSHSNWAAPGKGVTLAGGLPSAQAVP